MTTPVDTQREKRRRPAEEERPESRGGKDLEVPEASLIKRTIDTRGGALVSLAGTSTRKSLEPVWDEAKETLVHVMYAGATIGGIGALGNALAENSAQWGPILLMSPAAGWVAHRYSDGTVRKHMVNATEEQHGRVRRFIASVTTAAGGWLASASALGVDYHTPGGKLNLTVGAVLGLWAASPYIRFRSQGAAPPPAPPCPLEPQDDEPVFYEEPTFEEAVEPVLGWAVEVEKYAALWAKNVSPSNGALPGTSLLPETIREIKGGWTGIIAQDISGSFGPERFVPATGRVAAAFEIGLADITIEAMSDNASRASVTVLNDNPLVNFQVWQGPYAILGEEQVKAFDPNTGIAIIGVHSDGELVRYRFWNSGGAWHDLISGATGSGKSEFVNMLLGYERHASVEVPVLDDEGNPKLDENGEPITERRGLILSRVGDPQWGQSFGDWQDHVDWFAPTIDEIRIMLQKTEKEMYARNKKFGRQKWYDEKIKRWRRGVKNFRATPDMPLIVITLDEAHEILKDAECSRVVAVLGKMGRKVGIKLRLITQVPLLQELGNNMAIRDAVASGNVIVFRTANSLSGQVAFNGALPAQPSSIPREWPPGRAKPGQETTAGLGYALGASARAAIMRAFYPGDAVDWIYKGEELWGKPAELDLLTRAAGTGYEDRHKRLEDLDDMEDASPNPSASTARGSGMTCEQTVLQIFLSKANEDYKIKLEDLVSTINEQFSSRMISKVLSDFGKKGWTVSGKQAGAGHGWHQLTESGRAEGPDQLSQDNVVENPAADEQRQLLRR